MSDGCGSIYDAGMHLPYWLFMAPKVLYGAYHVRMSRRFPMSGHPGGPGPDKTANEVQCKTDKGDIKDTDPHDVDRRMKPFCRRGSADGYDLTSPCKSAFICGSGLHSPNKIHSRKDQGQQAIWTPCSASNFDDSVARSCRRRSGTLRVYKSVVTR